MTVPTILSSETTLTLNLKRVLQDSHRFFASHPFMHLFSPLIRMTSIVRSSQVNVTCGSALTCCRVTYMCTDSFFRRIAATLIRSRFRLLPVLVYSSTCIDTRARGRFSRDVINRGSAWMK